MVSSLPYWLVLYVYIGTVSCSNKRMFVLHNYPLPPPSITTSNNYAVWNHSSDQETSDDGQIWEWLRHKCRIKFQFINCQIESLVKQFGSYSLFVLLVVFKFLVLSPLHDDEITFDSDLWSSGEAPGWFHYARIGLVERVAKYKLLLSYKNS